MADDHTDEFANLRTSLNFGLAEDGRVSALMDQLTASVIQLVGAGALITGSSIGIAMTKHLKK